MADFDLNFEFEALALQEDAEIVITVDGEVVDIAPITADATGNYSFSLDYFSQAPQSFSISFANSGLQDLQISNFTINGEALRSDDFTAGQGAITNPDGSFSISNTETISWSRSYSAANSAPPPSNSNGIFAHIGSNRLDVGNDGNFAENPDLGPNVNGTAGDDTIYGSDEDNTINGYAGNDFIRGFLGDDILIGGEGNDKLIGDGGNDTINGDGGDDFIRGGDGNDTIYGDAGNDDLRGDTGDDFIDGGDGDDYITVEDGTNTLQGGAGNDIIRGGTGIDTVYGGDGNDDIRTGAGNDIIYVGEGNDFVQAGDGDDIIYSGLGINIINGGNGNDTVNYAYATQGVQINIDRGTDFDGDGDIDEKLVFIENAYATNFDDIIFSYDGHNGTFYALNGDDIFRGRTGVDTVYGGDGNDDIRTWDGDDIVDGGDGDDYILGEAGMDTLSGGAGKDFIRGGTGIDTIYGGAGNDRLYGDEGNDIIYGGDGSDLINGGAGNDQIYGGDGDDRLVGKEGNDIIYGGAGNDLIRGLEGMDTLYGGDGDDIFVFTLNDLTDTFHGGAGTDTLIVSGYDTSTVDLTTLNVTGLEVVSLINYGDGSGEVANQIIFNAGDVANITNTGTFTVMADAGDTITVSQLDATFFIETVDIDGTNYDRYTKNGTDFYFTSAATIELDDAAIANNDLFSVDEEATLEFTYADLLSNDINLTGATDPLQIISFGSATNGTLVINGTDISYTGDVDYYGTETITYTIQDENGDTDTGEIIITVNNINDAPIALNDDFIAVSGENFSGNLFENNGFGIDFDIDGDDLTLTQTGSLTTVEGETIVINADGSFIYSPGASFTGLDSYTYTIEDGNGGSDTATLTFNVLATLEPVTDILYNLVDPDFDKVTDTAIGNEGPYLEKTFGTLFTTGADVVSRQVIFEQGGTNRGYNLYIENGELFYSTWNFSQQSWGYKQISTSIEANTTYTSTMVTEGTADKTGTFTAFLDGTEIGELDGVGRMFDFGDYVNIGYSDSTNYGAGSNSNVYGFQGSIARILQANDALNPQHINEFEVFFLDGMVTPVLLLVDPESTDVITDARVDNDGPFDEKTLGARFTTGDDINSTQVIYEQGDTSRGMNIFIENGEVFIAAWNYNEQNWGYKEFSAGITANQTFSVTLILDGAFPANGTLTAYIDGQLVGEFDDVGYLYNHTGSIGIEQKLGGTVIHDIASAGTGLEFDGTLDKLVQYNEVLSASLLAQLEAYLADIKNTPILDPASETSYAILTGTDGNDIVYGDGANDVAFGYDGNDTINTYDGSDAVYGGNGNDTINSGNGNDLLYGQNGDDYLRSDAGVNNFYGGDGMDTIRGGVSKDTVYGGTGNDDIRTGDGGDYIYGEDGDDYIEAGNHNDVILGGAGNDIIKGGNNNDKLIGGAGTDRLYGDSGNDIFSFSADEDSFDFIYTFNMAEDIINISDLLTGYSGGDITDFAQLVHIGSRFDIQVDRDGTANGSNFETIAKVLTNIDDTITAQDLIDNNVLIANQSIII